MGPELMNICHPEEKGTKEWSKMLRRMLLLEEAKVPAKAAKDWPVEGKKVQITTEESKRLKREFEEDGQIMARKGLWNMAKRRKMMERRAIPDEMGDNVRECLTMGEEVRLSSWLRKEEEIGTGSEEGEEKEEEDEDMRKEEEGRTRKEEEEEKQKEDEWRKDEERRRIEEIEDEEEEDRRSEEERLRAGRERSRKRMRGR